MTLKILFRLSQIKSLPDVGVAALTLIHLQRSWTKGIDGGVTCAI